MARIEVNKTYEITDVFPEKRNMAKMFMEKYNVEDIHYAIRTDEETVPSSTCYPVKGRYSELYLRMDYGEAKLHELATELKAIVGCEVERTSFPAILKPSMVVFRVKDETLNDK